MATCKFCGQEIGWSNDGTRWVPLDDDGSRHNCRKSNSNSDMATSRVKVHCKDCNTWYPESQVSFVNIEEDERGFDVLTFDCPVCKQTQRSHRIG